VISLKEDRDKRPIQSHYLDVLRSRLIHKAALSSFSNKS